MRLAGVNIPDEKKVRVALTYVFGVGITSAKDILEKTKVDSEKRAKDLTAQEVSKIKDILEKDYKIEGELRASVRQDINRLKLIKSYRGTRHAKNLPVRGQSTKRNSRTRRGNVRATAGSGKRKLTLK